MESAQNERFKRRRAERECQQLRDAVCAQMYFIRGLKSVFLTPPSLTTGLNLGRYLHNYTRLPRDRPTRWNEYATLGQEKRLQAAMDILCRETESLTAPDLDAPYIQAELTPGNDGFGIRTTNVYNFGTTDLSAIFRGLCVAVSESVTACGHYQCTRVKGRVVDPDSPASGSNILYRVVDAHHKSRFDSDELSIESRIVTLYKQTDSYAVVLWDYVDDDELNPLNKEADITRQAIGA
jgi:hypothetical protein